MSDTILVLLFGDLGDTLLTVPALRAVRRRFPQGTVLLMAKAASGQLVRDLGLADEVIDVDKHALDRMRSLASPRTAAALVQLARRLRRRRIDQVIIFQHLTTRWGALKYACLSLLSGAPVRAGLDNGRGWFLTHRAVDRGFGAEHESEYWLEVAGLLGAEAQLELEAPISTDDERAAAELLNATRAGTKRIVAIHPGVGPYGPGRQWGAARFAETAALIELTAPVQCVLVGTETDREATEMVAASLGPTVVNLVGRTTTGVLAAVLRRCDLLLSNDGGVGHLAAAVGTPTLTVFGPSNDAAWRPLGGEVISADIPCRPCFYRDFEIGLRSGCTTRECLALVTPRAVAERAVELLRGAPVAL